MTPEICRSFPRGQTLGLASQSDRPRSGGTGESPRVTQRREHFRFALKARDSLRVGNEELRQDLDCDLAIESRVARAIHLTHAAGPEGGEDLERAEAGAGGEGQLRRRGLYGRGRPPGRDYYPESRRG